MEVEDQEVAVRDQHVTCRSCVLAMRREIPKSKVHSLLLRVSRLRADEHRRAHNSTRNESFQHVISPEPHLVSSTGAGVQVGCQQKPRRDAQ
jgi:hypothetical protein